MPAPPLAVLAREAYAVDDASRPPCVKAVHRPNASGPLTTGAIGISAEELGVAEGVAAVARVGTGVTIGAWTPC